jgi:hypothetical protein
VARALFNSIQGPALAFPQTQLTADGAPVFAGYSIAEDPQCVVAAA